MFELIKQFEGCKLDSYKCPAGVWTIGWGSTKYKDGTPVKQGEHISQAEADDLLMWYCATQIKLPKGNFNESQIDALFSLIYNIGQTAFDKSKCKKYIENEEWQKAWENWDWTKANGIELKGLVKRRNEERKKFFKSIVLDIPF